MCPKGFQAVLKINFLFYTILNWSWKKACQCFTSILEIFIKYGSENDILAKVGINHIFNHFKIQLEKMVWEYIILNFHKSGSRPLSQTMSTWFTLN